MFFFCGKCHTPVAFRSMAPPPPPPLPIVAYTQKKWRRRRRKFAFSPLLPIGAHRKRAKAEWTMEWNQDASTRAGLPEKIVENMKDREKRPNFLFKRKMGKVYPRKWHGFLYPPPPLPHTVRRKSENLLRIFIIPPLFLLPWKKVAGIQLFFFFHHFSFPPFFSSSVTGVTKISTINPFLPPPFLFPVRQGKKMHLAADEIFPYTKKTFLFLTVLFSTHTHLLLEVLFQVQYFFWYASSHFFWLTSWHICFF